MWSGITGDLNLEQFILHSASLSSPFAQIDKKKLVYVNKQHRLLFSCLFDKRRSPFNLVGDISPSYRAWDNQILKAKILK